MPAPANPTNLSEGQSAIFEPTTAGVGNLLYLNPAFSWRIFHTGVDGNGDEDISPVAIAVRAEEVLFAKGEGRQVVVAGSAITLPRGVDKVALIAAAGAPLLNISSDKEQ